MKRVFALAALAAIGFAGIAFAGEASTGAWTTSTAAAPTAMSDKDMDKVTAGAVGGVHGANNTYGNFIKPDVCAHGACKGGNSDDKFHPVAPTL